MEKENRWYPETAPQGPDRETIKRWESLGYPPYKKDIVPNITEEEEKYRVLSEHAEERAQRYSRCELLKEDLVGEAMLRICEPFSKNKSVEEMKNILSKEMENTYKRSKRKLKKNAKHGYVEGSSLDEALDKAGHEFTLKDTYIEPGFKDQECERGFAFLDPPLKFEDILSKMSVFERQIVNCYDENLQSDKKPPKQKEIADKLGCSVRTIRRYLKNKNFQALFGLRQQKK